MRELRGAMLCGLCIYVLYTPAAEALPPFKAAFEEKYVQPANDPVFAQNAKAAGCMICHVKGAKKNVRNGYGEALANLIGGDAQKRLKAAAKAGAEVAEKDKIMKELDAAFSKVEAEKSPSGATYGELLKLHKLPQ